ncbi:MAG: isoaspartyl peptidase/L-asparaginase family protein [Chromatiaceae bacterium]
MDATFSLMVHGGASDLDSANDEKIADSYRWGISRALDHGRDMLSSGASALDTVEACACLLEDDPIFNAGRGSVLNADGRVEMDAGIMDGRDLAAGAVAAVCHIANPVRLARLIMENSEHVLLTGQGAVRFAVQYGVELAPDHYFLTAERVAELNRARSRAGTPPDHGGPIGSGETHGTIGAVARDLAGNLAAATSSGGIVNKRAGRVGDSPMIGAGFFADNETCAVSTTGRGEDFMRTLIAKRIADVLHFRGGDARSAVTEGMDYLRRRIAGRGGVIAIDKDGNCASAHTTKAMIHGWIELGGETFSRC